MCAPVRVAALVTEWDKSCIDINREIHYVSGGVGKKIFLLSANKKTLVVVPPQNFFFFVGENSPPIIICAAAFSNVFF